MGWFIDITDHKYNWWTVLRKTKNRDVGGNVMWMCRCKCGTVREVAGNSLRNGSSKSCGCSKVKNKTFADLTKKNIYNVDGETGYGYTTNTHQRFYFDIEVYDKIKIYSWHKGPNGYITSSTFKGVNNNQTVFLHEVVTGFKFNGIKMIDHIDGNTFNNVNSNLRIVTYSQNAMNTAIRSDNTSGCKGVSYNKKGDNWYVRIAKNKNNFNLGLHKNKLDAIKHREIAELYLFNEYSREHEELKEKYKTIDVVDFLKQHHPKIIEKFPSEVF